MKILVTGSAGYLGEALVRTLLHRGDPVVGVDIRSSPFTSLVGSIADRDFTARCMTGVDRVLHAAALHKPHVEARSRAAFVDTNITGTLNLLEAAVNAGVRAFVFTSTTSVFGRALYPPPRDPAIWVTESLAPVPRNIYGVTKAAAEDLCQLLWSEFQLPVVTLRTSRFFPEEDDDARVRATYADGNIKAVEFLYRRVALEDVVDAHFCALEAAPRIGHGRYIISATTPFEPGDVVALRADAPSVVGRRAPEYEDVFARRGWRMFPRIDRVYDNTRARDALRWSPQYDFHRVLTMVAERGDFRGPLARAMPATPIRG